MTTTRRLRLLAVLGCAGMSAETGALAADKVLYQPPPAWVKPAPPVDAATIDGESPIMLVFDDQERLGDGQVWTYRESVTRLASPDVVKQAGTLSLSWQPAKGDLVVHAVEILRGGSRIDALAGGKAFTVIRREQQLERAAIDGELTATLAVEGLQVGDLLRVAASTTNREPALNGALQTVTAMPMLPQRVGFARVRMLWPDAAAMHWKTHGEGAKTSTSVAGGIRELVVTGPLPKPPELPGDVPARFNSLPIIEAASFADWAAVSRTFAPLYATDGLIAADGDLARAVAAIAAAEQDPLKRAAAALQLVQDKVRYLYNGLENGNYVPQTAVQTWSLRYGDCKAKTLLLLAILHALKIEAEPVFASAEGGDLVPMRLPSAAAFDHVLVRATIGGQSYWLDGTGSGARYADIRDTPPLRWVLPLRATGAALMPVPMRAPAMPMMDAVLDYDQRAGLKLPTLVHAVMKVRGPYAEMIGLAKTQGSKEQKDTMVGGAVGSLTGRPVAITDYTMTYDAAGAEAVIDASGIMTTPWQLDDKRYRMDLDKAVSGITFEPDRALAAWRTLPVATSAPTTMALTFRIALPPDLAGFALEGDTTLAKPLAGTRIARRATVAGTTITVNDRVEADGVEIAAADIPMVRADVALAKTRLLKAVAPETPARWAMAAAARREGRIKPLAAAYAKAIAIDPDKAEGYVNRAAFYEGIYDWSAALADRERAANIDPSATNLAMRGNAYRNVGNDAKAAADYKAVLAIDPAARGTLAALGGVDIAGGRGVAAVVARIDDQIAAGGARKADMLLIKAELLGRSGDKDGAIAAIDAAIAIRPGNPQLLNSRCWIKATLGIALDTALKDCTRSIELSDSTVAALDSRAMVYFRMNRLDEATADLDAALDSAPDMSASLYMRGIIRGRQGKAGAKQDLLAARTMAPLIDAEYRQYGIAP